MSRRLALRLWLLAMAASTLNALRIVLFDWSGFVQAFPGATTPSHRAIAVALPLGLLLALVGVWLARRWGIVLLAIMVVATCLFDLVARGPWLHLLAAVISSALLAALLWWNRDLYCRDSRLAERR